MAPSDLLTFALFIGGFILLSRLLKSAVKSARNQEALQQAQQPAPLPEEALSDATWGSDGPQPGSWQGATSAELARRMETIAPGIRPQRTRTSSNPLFRTRQDLRHAVVAMTVLGPCRALDPPDRGQTGAALGGTAPGAL
jgi:hypothetical protein